MTTQDTAPLSEGQHQTATGLALDAMTKNRPFDHVLAKAKAFFLGWTVAFRPVLETHDILEVESEFTFPLLNPETEAPSRTFLEAGKIDGRLLHRASGIRKVLEHKTTSDSLEPDSDYWPQLVMDSQVSKYILAGVHRGDDIQGILYDVVRKPAQRVSQIALTDADGVKIVLDAAGERVRTKDGKKWRQTGDTELGYVLQTREETPEEHFQRVYDEMQSDPAKYFVQKEIPRLDSDLLEYMQDAWSLSQQILYFRKANLWPRNPDACIGFGKCEFFSLCSGRSSVDGINFRNKDKKHAELAITEGEKEFLTNSRLRALRKCARYHFLRYEEPVEPVLPPSEALRIGTLFHLGTEIFLNQFIKK